MENLPIELNRFIYSFVGSPTAELIKNKMLYYKMLYKNECDKNRTMYYYKLRSHLNISDWVAERIWAEDVGYEDKITYKQETNYLYCMINTYSLLWNEKDKYKEFDIDWLNRWTRLDTRKN